MSKKTALRFATFALAIVNALVCPAQVEQGAITGLVTDQSGASVAGTKVSVTNLDTQVTISTITNSQGNYTFPFLSHGNYSVAAEKAGFSQERVTGVSLRVGLTAT